MARAVGDKNKKSSQSTVQSQAAEPNTIVIESSPTTSFTLENPPEDLQGAVNLTEAAKLDMVSTEVNLTDATAAAQTPAATRWCVQVGAFSSQENATNYANTLRTQINLPVSGRADGNLFRVSV